MTDEKDIPSKLLRSQFRVVADSVCHPVSDNGATSQEKNDNLQKSYAQVDPGVAPRGRASAQPKPGKRLHPLGVRFSAAELEIVKRKARDGGCTVNSYIRASALGSEYKAPVHQELRLTLLASNRELTAIGRNINQIAKQLNTGKQVGRITLEGLQAALFTTLAMVRTALARRREP